MRRLAAKCAIGRTAEALAPLQLKVSVGGGAEAIHATRRYVINMPADHVFVKLDSTNAFKTLRCDAMLEAMMCAVPELYQFAHAAYTVEPILQYNSNTVQTCEGPQQGDPLGPLIICITIPPLLRRLRSELRIGHLDDLTAGGRVDLVARNVELLEREATALRLQLNKAKCEFITKNAKLIMQKEFEGSIRTPFNGMRLLGVPVMPGDEVTAVLSEKTEDLRRASNFMPHFATVSGCADVAEVQSQHPQAAPHIMHVRLSVKPCAGRVRQDFTEMSVGHLECRDV